MRATRQLSITLSLDMADVVGPAYDALKADPARAVTADQVRTRLAAEYAKAR